MDQLLSSLTNVTLGFFVASSVSLEQFGGFSVAFLIYLLVLGVSSSVASEPLVVVHSSDDASSVRRAAKQATGCALLIGSVSGLLLFVTGTIIGGPVGESLVPMGLLLGGLLLQDSVRYVLFAQKAPSSAVLNDFAWAALQVTGFVIAYSLGEPSVRVLITVWGLSATTASVLGLMQCRLLPTAASCPTWWRSKKYLAKPFAADFIFRQGAGQVGMYAVGFVAGLDALASLRGAMLLMGPISMLTAGIRIVALPEGARVRDQSYDQLPRAAAFAGAILAVSALLWVIAVMTLSDRIGQVLLGASWVAAREILPAIAVVTTAGALAASPLFGLRVLGDGRRLIRARSIDAPLTVAGLLAGAAFGQARGAAIGWAMANVCSAGMWWWTFAKSHASGPHNRSLIASSKQSSGGCTKT